MTKTFCDRCGERIGEEVGTKSVTVSVTVFDEDGDVIEDMRTSGDTDLCRACADIVLKAMEPTKVKAEEVSRG